VVLPGGGGRDKLRDGGFDRDMGKRMEGIRIEIG
jgi:hypothetical protein